MSQRFLGDTPISGYICFKSTESLFTTPLPCLLSSFLSCSSIPIFQCVVLMLTLIFLAIVAFVILTKTYYHKYRLFTIRNIIKRWAPSNENDTEAYIKKVSDLTGIDSDEPLGIPSLYPSRWMALGLAMAIVEGGRQPAVFPMMQGWTLARVGQ